MRITKLLKIPKHVAREGHDIIAFVVDKKVSDSGLGYVNSMAFENDSIHGLYIGRDTKLYETLIHVITERDEDLLMNTED